jgi:outer membrane murein-binding lipoprotein Lpp
MNRKAVGPAIAVPFSALLLSACVSQQQYDAVVAENNQLKAQLAQSQAQLAQSQAEQKFVEAGDLLFPSGGFQMGPAGQAEIANNVVLG